MNPTVQGIGRAVGTCGELVQGTRNGRELMVTFPVDWYTDVVVRSSYLPGVRVWPQSKVKVRRMCELLLGQLTGFPARDMGLEVLVNSSIPEGRGYASSSSDLVAACRAFGHWSGTPMADETVMRLCCELEPSDAVCFSAPAMFDFINGDVLHLYSDSPGITALVLEEGGHVDTLTMRRFPYDQEEQELLAEAFNLVEEGLTTGDMTMVGHAATLSAVVNQRRLPKRHLEVALKVSAITGGHGVSVAHSGTTLALLFDRHDVAGVRAAAAQLRELTEDCDLFVLHSPWTEGVTTTGKRSGSR